MKKNQPVSFKYWFLSICTQKNSPLREGGYILIIVIAIIVGLAGLVALFAQNSSSNQASVVNQGDSSSGFYAAEAALNLRADEIRQTFIDFNQPAGVSPTSSRACFDGNTSNNGSGDFECLTTTYTGANNNRSDFSATTYVVEQNGGEPIEGVVPQGDLYQGLNMDEYAYSIYALSFKDSNLGSGQGQQPNAILQLDIKARSIPMFQFAAFYDGDLEILPGPTMTLNGPVHTNGYLFLGSGNSLTIAGQVSTVRDIYSCRKTNSGNPPTCNNAYNQNRVFIEDLANNPLELLQNGTGSTSATTNPMDPTLIANNWGSQVQVRTDDPISLPPPGFLDRTGEYFLKADIRFEYTPRDTSDPNYDDLSQYIPFELYTIKRDNDEIQPPIEEDFDGNIGENQRRSLLQPVMVEPDLEATDTDPGNFTTASYYICDADEIIDDSDSSNWYNPLNNTQKETARGILQDFVQEQILSSDRPILLPELDQRLRNTSFISNGELDALATDLSNSGIPTIRNNIRDFTIQEIAGLEDFSGSFPGITEPRRCFIAAPVMDIGRNNAGDSTNFRFYNEREDRDMRVLQINFQSLAVWNRDGKYLDASDSLTSANELLYFRAGPDANAPANSFQRLGVAASDTTNGGIVIHATIAENLPTYPAGESPYAFGVVKGQQLFGLATSNTYDDPTGITFATDQAVYVQGHYNRDNLNYQPAAFLADSFSPLSNTCLTDDTHALNHGTGIGCDTGGSLGSYTNRRPVDTTEFNAALLAGTDITDGGNYNGGLENYPRFLEDWSGRRWRYRGSFVSLNTPTHVSGDWSYGSPVYTAPIRDWDYDVRFNSSRNLPPLSPRFVALKQESFIRNFDN